MEACDRQRDLQIFKPFTFNQRNLGAVEGPVGRASTGVRRLSFAAPEMSLVLLSAEAQRSDCPTFCNSSSDPQALAHCCGCLHVSCGAGCRTKEGSGSRSAREREFEVTLLMLAHVGRIRVKRAKGQHCRELRAVSEGSSACLRSAVSDRTSVVRAGCECQA